MDVTATCLSDPIVVDLLSSLSGIADSSSQLSERRMAVMSVLIRLTNSEACMWAWGRGHPRSNTVVPLAMIDVGMTGVQRLRMMELGNRREMRELFQLPVLQKSESDAETEDAQQMTTVRRDLVVGDDPSGDPFRADLRSCEWDEWLHCVRYSVHETWSMLMFFRGLGSPAYSAGDKVIVDLSMQGIPWLHANCAEAFPSEAMSFLTPRQRTVMLMLLDGQPRKKIAHHLGLSEETIHDYVRTIYTHFKVRSAVELSAIFLRSK